jgi:hypothetical protein
MTRSFYRMRSRSLLALLAALAVAVAACSDETPTFSGSDPFPTGGMAVTREVILPAGRFFEVLGDFSGYTSAYDAENLVVANQYQGEFNAHALARFTGFPTEVTYTRAGVPRTDKAFSYMESRLVMDVDTMAVAGAPFTVQVWQAAQRWDPLTATWTLAIDSTGVQDAWTEPGGTRGILLGQATYVGNNVDSVVVTLSPDAVRRLADSLSNGVVMTVAETGKRVELGIPQLRLAVKPDSASPDTTINLVANVGFNRTTVYTPEQPDAPAGGVAVGGVRSARTLLELNLEQTVPGCAAGQSCPEVPLSQVQLNQVAILLRPAPVPGGFRAPNLVPLALRLVVEPELGRVAPLGQTVLDGEVFVSSADSLVVLPVTNLAGTYIANDSVPRTVALVSEESESGRPPTFGVLFLDPDARLRIVYTLPARRPLP